MANIAIIGAGIGGLTAAALLQRRGHETNVYEQAQKFARVGAGIQQSANSIRVLRKIGLEERLRKIAFQPRYLNNREWDTGIEKFKLPIGDVYESKYGAPYLLLHRGDLHAILADAVDEKIIHRGMQLDSVEPNDDCVKMRFANGEEKTADCVIAADGVHSVIREWMLGADNPRFTGRVAYRTTFKSDLLKGLQIDDCTKWWGIDRHIVIYYITPSRDEIYFVTSVPEPDWKNESWSTRGDLSQLRQAFKGFHPQVQAVLSACPEVHKWALYEREPLPRWSKGRVVLMGDACHAMVPYMAQGAATAIEDSEILARCLDETKDIALAFQQFEKTRIERTSRIQKSSQKNEWLSKSPKEEADWLFGYDPLTAPLAPIAL